MALTTRSHVWRTMADEARAVASRMHDSGLRQELLKIAAGYDALAGRAEATTGEVGPGKSDDPLRINRQARREPLPGQRPDPERLPGSDDRLTPRH